MADNAIYKFERAMHRQESHLAMACLDKYIRDVSKQWTKASKQADESGSQEEWTKILVDTSFTTSVLQPY